MIGSRRKVVNGTSASFICARTRSSALAAASPANSSPDLAGDAFASNSRSTILAIITDRAVLEPRRVGLVRIVRTETRPFSQYELYITMRAFLSVLILSASALAAGDFDSLIKQGRAAVLALDLDAAQTAYAQACPAEKMAAFPLQNVALCEYLLGTVAEAREHGDEAASLYLE